MIIRIPVLVYSILPGYDEGRVAEAIEDVLDGIARDAVAAGCPVSHLRERFEEAIRKTES